MRLLINVDQLDNAEEDLVWLLAQPISQRPNWPVVYYREMTLPLIVATQLAYGRVAIRTGRPDLAEDMLTAAVKAHPIAPVYHERALMRLQVSRGDTSSRRAASERDLREAVRLSPVYAQAWVTLLIDGRDASPLIDSRSTVERMFLSDAELSQTLIRRAWLHYELKRDELAASDILRAVELGGRRQILKLQLLLKRNGMTVTIDGEKSEQLSDRVKDCFAETACREGLSTPL